MLLLSFGCQIGPKYSTAAAKRAVKHAALSVPGAPLICIFFGQFESRAVLLGERFIVTKYFKQPRLREMH